MTPKRLSLILDRGGEVFQPTQERWVFIDKDVLQQFAKAMEKNDGKDKEDREEGKNRSRKNPTPRNQARRKQGGPEE